MSSPSTHPLRALVAKLETIGRLPDEMQQAIERLPTSIRTLQPRHDIVRDGDRPTQSCLLLDGWACRYSLLPGGKRQLLSFHIAGDVPDLLSLHLGVMDHSLCTLTAVTAAFIPHQNIRDLTQQFPVLASILWRETLVDAATFRKWMVGIGRRSAQERLAHLFCELYLKQHAIGLADAYKCSMPMTQTDLADALGLTNVHVNRVLQDLRSEGLIALRNGELVIHDWHRLVALAEFDPTYLHLTALAQQ